MDPVLSFVREYLTSPWVSTSFYEDLSLYLAQEIRDRMSETKDLWEGSEAPLNQKIQDIARILLDYSAFGLVGEMMAQDAHLEASLVTAMEQEMGEEIRMRLVPVWDGM